MLTQLGIHKIPDCYIKERWTTAYLEDKIKKQKILTSKSEGNQSDQQALRYAMMMERSAIICANMCIDAKKSQKFMDELAKAVEKIENESLAEQHMESAGSTSVYKDPTVQVAVNVKKGQRLLRQAEKSTKKKGSSSKKKPAVKAARQEVVLTS